MAYCLPQSGAGARVNDVCVCVCVGVGVGVGVLSSHLFWTLDLWKHQPRSRKRKVTQDFSAVLALFVYREKDPAVPIPCRR